MPIVAYTDQQLLDAVEAALMGTLTRQAASIVISGRTVDSFSPKELLDLRDRLKSSIAQTASGGHATVVRFQEPG